MAHKWAGCLRTRCQWVGTHRFTAGGRITFGPQVGCVAKYPIPPGRFPSLLSREQNQRWPTSYVTLAAWGSLPNESRGEKERWPTTGPGGYTTPAAWGVPTTSQRGAESQVAHKWVGWVHYRYRVGGLHRFKVGPGVRSGPQVGQVVT